MKWQKLKFCVIWNMDTVFINIGVPRNPCRCLPSKESLPKSFWVRASPMLRAATIPISTQISAVKPFLERIEYKIWLDFIAELITRFRYLKNSISLWNNQNISSIILSFFENSCVLVIQFIRIFVFLTQISKNFNKQKIFYSKKFRMSKNFQKYNNFKKITIKNIKVITINGHDAA